MAAELRLKRHRNPRGRQNSNIIISSQKISSSELSANSVAPFHIGYTSKLGDSQDHTIEENDIDFNKKKKWSRTTSREKAIVICLNEIYPIQNKPQLTQFLDLIKLWLIFRCAGSFSMSNCLDWDTQIVGQTLLWTFLCRCFLNEINI